MRRITQLGERCLLLRRIPGVGLCLKSRLISVLKDWIESSGTYCRDCRRSELDDAAFQSDGDGVSAIVCVKLGKNTLHVSLDGIFRNVEIKRDHLVGFAGSDLTQDLSFPLGQSI